MAIPEKVRQVCSLMDPIMEDRSVPRNIRQKLHEAKERMLNEKENLDVAIATAVYALDEASNDINVPSHARTDVFNIISELERLKNELKGAKA